jgi:hypothetical protein
MSTTPTRPTTRIARIPLPAKLLYSAFVCLLVPNYLRAYGPTNFLYFCDVALLLTGIAMWTESALLVSACAVGILFPQALWIADFLSTMVGHPITGMTAYMFNPAIPAFSRFLSFFHFWLPLLLVWLLWRLGYDRRGLRVWIVVAWCLMATSYAFLPPPPAPPADPGLPVNVNYVYGLSDDAPQTWLPPWLYFSTLLLALPVLIFVPSHFALQRLFRDRTAGRD